MKILEFEHIHEKDLSEVARAIKGKIPTPAVLILSGPMGAGKTTFVKSFVGQNEGDIVSPTYSLINESGNVAHADFYRLKGKEELIHLELDLYAEGKDFFLIEWGKPFVEELRYFLSGLSFFELVFQLEEDFNCRTLVLNSLIRDR